MATRTWAITKDTNVSQLNGGFFDGNANDQHTPIGTDVDSAGTVLVYRYFAQFAVDTSGMASISSAVLHIRATTQVHIPFGSSPTLVCRRVTVPWVGSGGSEGNWSLTANPKWDTQPGTSSSNETTRNMTTTNNAWDTVLLTDIARDWLGGSPNYGIRLTALSESPSSNDKWEGYAQASSYKPYITVTYTPTAVTHPPTALPLEPATGDLANVAYTAGSGWPTPRPTVSWAFNDLDAGQAQSAYQVLVLNDSGGIPGSTFYDSGKVTSAATSLQIPATFVQGNYYHWKVQVWDSLDTPSLTYTTPQRFRVQWGAAEYYFNMGSTPLEWSLSELATQGLVTIEYNSSTNSADPGGSIGTWQSSLALVTKRQYVRYRVWLLPNNGIDPHLDKLVITYNTAALPTLDNWTQSAHAVADASTRVYGVQSLRINAVGADERSYQLVKVEPNTIYQLTGRIKQSVVGVGAFISLGTTTTGGTLVSAPGSATELDWSEAGVEWDSGAATSVYVQCGASGTGTAWFDAIKLEASTVPTQWHPALLNKAVVVDAAGLKVDASMGATVRLRGSTGGTRDIVEIGTNGLKFGGSVQVSSPAAGQLSFGLAGWHGGEITDPAAPAANTGVTYYRDNGAGKTQLVVRFPTGAIQVIATEP